MKAIIVFDSLRVTITLIMRYLYKELKTFLAVPFFFCSSLQRSLLLEDGLLLSRISSLQITMVITIFGFYILLLCSKSTRLRKIRSLCLKSVGSCEVSDWDFVMLCSLWSQMRSFNIFSVCWTQMLMVSRR